VTIHPKTLAIVAFVMLVAGLLTLIVVFAAPPPPPLTDPRTVRQQVFDLLSTDDLCGRLRSPDYLTRETALIAMKTHTNIMPTDSARVLCEAVAVGAIGDEGRERELMNFHLARHRHVIVSEGVRLMEEVARSGSVTLCNGQVITPSPDNMKVLEDWLRGP